MMIEISKLLPMVFVPEGPIIVTGAVGGSFEGSTCDDEKRDGILKEAS
jgi:hypothetical protein